MRYDFFKRDNQTPHPRHDPMTSSSFAITPAGQQFPRFAFLHITRDKVNVTHHHMDGKVLRKRTDTLSAETASQLITALRKLGYSQTTGLL